MEPRRPFIDDRYEFLRLLATGGMGQVWCARDTLLHRDVAVKVLRSEFTGNPTFLARFRGDAEPVDPRAGHIPGARNLPARDNVDERGRLLPPEELRRRFAAVGVTDGTPVVSYCGSGVTACANLLVLEHAGLAPGRLYPGSWSQYSATDRPAATGSA